MNYGKRNILIYDNENIKYFSGTFTTIAAEPNLITYEGINDRVKTTITRSHTITLETSDLEEFNNIELDDTTMKRIAKFNKEQECKRLEQEIEKKQNKIKELDNLLKDKEKRWNKVKEYIAKIYEIDINDDYDDYDDYDDCYD